MRAWRTAVGVARGERHWEALVAVGDASLRLGAIPGIHEWPEAGARSMYVEALFRARQQRSLRGIVQIAQRFAWLGDMEVVERSLRLTDSLAPTVAADAETLAALELLRVRSELRLSQARRGRTTVGSPGRPPAPSAGSTRPASCATDIPREPSCGLLSASVYSRARWGRPGASA